MLTVTCRVHDAEYWDEGVQELLGMCLEAVFSGAVTVEKIEGLPGRERQLDFLTGAKSPDRRGI